MKKIAISFTVLLLIAFIGCGGGDDGGTDPPPPPVITRLVVDTTVTAPNMTDVDEAVWSQVDSVAVTVGGFPSTYGRNGTLGEVDVYMKAIKKNDKLYIRAEWHDATANIFAHYIRNVRINENQNLWEHATVNGEDVFGIIFEGPNNGDEGADCATMCHATTMKTTGGGTVDAWRWGSGSTAYAKVLDDKQIDAVGVSKDASFYNSWNPARSNYRITHSFPERMAADTSDFNGVFLDFATAISYDDGIYFPYDYKMPGYTIDTSIFGAADRNQSSICNVRAISHYDSAGIDLSDYTWTVVFERQLFTGFDDDISLNSLDSVEISIAVTHNDRWEIVDAHSGSKPFYLILKP